MSVNSYDARRLLLSEMEDVADYSDSDDCVTDDEGIMEESESRRRGTGAVRKQFITDEKDEFDYHKMRTIENRNYQVELLELAKKLNIIICLPTGSGKTFIALKLTEYMLPQAIQEQKKIIFLANNVPLVHQQAKYFSANLVSTALEDDKYVRAISGDLNVDIWKQEQWDEVLGKYHILVMSTQILLDAVNKAYVKWSQIALLILDECHHAQKSHPMAELMKNYGERKACGNYVPKVLGLTATIIKGQSSEAMIERDISDIEKLLCCKAVTHTNYEEVLKNSTDTTMKTVVYHPKYSIDDATCTEMNEFIMLLDKLPKNFLTDSEVSLVERINHPSLTSEEQIFNKNKGVPKSLKSFLSDLLKTYEELGPYCCKMAAVLKLVLLRQWVQQLDELVEDNDGCPQESISILLYNAQTVVLQFMKKLDIQMAAVAERANQPNSEKVAIRYSISSKIEILWELLKTTQLQSKNEGSGLCGLIFCQRRITAQALKWYLQKAAELFPEELGFVKPEVIVGHSTVVQNTEAARFTAKKQTNTIRRFHLQELNVLVATQVVEEGLNVPICNLVVRFDSIQTYPSFVQSMGRARKRGAVCYALIEESEKEKERKKISSFVAYNQRLALELEKNAIHVGEDVETETVDFDQPIPPFCPSEDPDGPMITATDAISLVYRYTNSLSCDKIGSLFPTAWESRPQAHHATSPSFKAYVMLPILSPVRDVVEGEWMPDKTLAKRSAYLEVCKKLYYAKELTENLLPKPRSIDNFKCEFLEALEAKYQEEKSTTDIKIGTRQRVQIYTKTIPKVFEDKSIKANSPLHSYKIEISLLEYCRDEESKELYNFEKYRLSYGILTSSALAVQVPVFKLQANYGTFKVKINECQIGEGLTVTLDESQKELIGSFQNFLCKTVYNIKHPFMVLEKSPYMMIVPLRKQTQSTTRNRYDIEWRIMEDLVSYDEKNLLDKHDEDKRNTQEFNPEMYENSILVPWYKEDQVPEFYCAVKVLHGENSLSQFDEPQKYLTFTDYYSKKYKVNICKPENPLIQVKSVGSQLNFLTKKTDGKALRRDIQRSLLKLVPELTNIHRLPGSLFVQGRLLPSILHRVCRLLVANDFREDVADYFNWIVDASLDERDESSEESISEDEDQELGSNLGQLALSRTDTPKKPKKNEPIFLDEMNPFKISWDVIPKLSTTATPLKKRAVRDTEFAMPEPPILKSDFKFELVPINEIDFPSFDKATDFTKEKGPSMETLMEALTLSNSQDCISLEKLEVIGDSVLKVIVSLHLFRSFSTWDEGKMTLLRMQLISNRHLYQIGTAHKIGQLLSGSYFIPTYSWVPCGLTIPLDIAEWMASMDMGYESFKDMPSFSDLDMDMQAFLGLLLDMVPDLKNIGFTHSTYLHSKIADKSIADAVEAIIGAYYINGGIDGVFRILNYLGLRGPLSDGSAVIYSRESTLNCIPENIEFPRRGGKSPTGYIPLLNDLEKTLNYKFKNPWLAVEALTHPTYIGNRDTPCYERLEYVGDALLDFLVTDYIVKKTKITDPGQITDLRAALVNNVTFASLAVRYGFHTFLKFQSELLGNFITQFVEHQEENNHAVSDPFKLLSDFDCPTVREIEVPKVLGDIFESIAGAVFVDSMSIDTVWRVFFRLMKNELELFSKKIPKNPLRQLYEQFPRHVKFRKLSADSTSNPKKKDHVESKFQMVFLKVPAFEKSVLGVGSTIKQAKQAAAKFVIRTLREKSLITDD